MLRGLVDPSFAEIPISRQCELLGLPRASYYYQPAPVSEEDLELMRLIDLKFTKTPFYGTRRMTVHLQDDCDKDVNRKHVRRLMQLMGLETIYPKPNLSKPAPEHRIYPYLLRGVVPGHANHVWSTDITYIRMQKGFLYLVAILDWYSRMVLAWELSNTLDASFCIQALTKALDSYGTPDIFNTDQGAQFTSNDFTSILLAKGAKISMDGRGRALDNVFVERLWRSVKYEEVYLKDYRNGLDAFQSLGDYFKFYNHARPHQGLDNRTPFAVYNCI